MRNWAVQGGFALLLMVYCLTAAAGDTMPDAPLEPSWDIQAAPTGDNGSILEFWLLPTARSLERLPVDPSITGMIDDSEQVFAGSAMLKDPEMKAYVNQTGLLQWTTYFNVKKPGKHVFVITITGAENCTPSWLRQYNRSGIILRINGEDKLSKPFSETASATVEFAKPGLYTFQPVIWFTHDWNKFNWQDIRVSVKVREPGALGQRQMTKKDFFYRLPE